MQAFHRILTGAEPGPTLLVTGGVHGDEYEPIISLRRLIRRFDDDPTLMAGLRGRLIVVPIVNLGAFWNARRTAEDGLDLARVCPGDPFGSTTLRAGADLAALIRQADFYIDLHAGGLTYQVQPLAGYMLHPDPKVLDVQRRMATAFNLPIVWGTSPKFEGRSLSVARDALVPAIYCEYLGGAAANSAGIGAYLEGCLNVLAEVGMLDRPRPASRVTRIVEDPRDESGHMQICHRAEIAGVFEPCVQLGDVVQLGQPIGAVDNINSLTRQVVTADRAGMVIVLRWLPRVLVGDSLAVIMELPG